MHIPNKNPQDEGVDIDSLDDAPLGSFRLGCKVENIGVALQRKGGLYEYGRTGNGNRG